MAEIYLKRKYYNVICGFSCIKWISPAVLMQRRAHNVFYIRDESEILWKLSEYERGDIFGRRDFHSYRYSKEYAYFMYYISIAKLKLAK